MQRYLVEAIKRDLVDAEDEDSAILASRLRRSMSDFETLAVRKIEEPAGDLPQWSLLASCPYCGEPESDDQELRSRSGIEHDGDEGTVECKECKKTYKLFLTCAYFFKTQRMDAS